MNDEAAKRRMLYELHLRWVPNNAEPDPPARAILYAIVKPPRRRKLTSPDNQALDLQKLPGEWPKD